MPKFRKKPVVIDAYQWTGDWELLDAWIVSLGYDAWEGAADDGSAMWLNADHTLTIPTLEGDHTAQVNDWIIRGVQGEFYPCKPDIFEQTYEDAAASQPPTLSDVLAAIDSTTFVTAKAPTEGEHEAVHLATEGVKAAREAVEALYRGRG